MSASVQDHFHICETAAPGDTTTTGEWKAMAPGMKPRAIPQYSIIAAPLRALDGTLHVHVLCDDQSDPVVITDWTIQVRCNNWANVDTWSGYLGATKYYICNNHDPLAHNSYTQKVLVDRVGEVESPGPSYPVIYVLVHLTDASQ